ncbi:hypothetical protein SAMN05443270_4613 [Lacrimispora sphenoides]|jgi:hypothetical protein|uniref:hypothetical protein n=1 Tax=Lacrimispora sphenoides TaxID=29370 RepID=UPI0008B24327|nr:hypothetical protein [Lacrimispora sphenoides]SEU28771.1 hypothetical protein SAMN05443270_4613 [Lacrimispora sphenoides]
MKKTILFAFLFIFITLACLTILIGGTELIKHYTRLNEQFYAYMYQIMILRLLLPFSLGLLLFFRQWLREKIHPIPRVDVDGLATLAVVVYLSIISRKFFPEIFIGPEALLCFALFLSSFVNSLLVWKKYKENLKF